LLTGYSVGLQISYFAFRPFNPNAPALYMLGSGSAGRQGLPNPGLGHFHASPVINSLVSLYNLKASAKVQTLDREGLRSSVGVNSDLLNSLLQILWKEKIGMSQGVDQSLSTITKTTLDHLLKPTLSSPLTKGLSFHTIWMTADSTLGGGKKAEGLI